jgi:hypothetical protein
MWLLEVNGELETQLLQKMKRVELPPTSTAKKPSGNQTGKFEIRQVNGTLPRLVEGNPLKTWRLPASCSGDSGGIGCLNPISLPETSNTHGEIGMVCYWVNPT